MLQIFFANFMCQIFTHNLLVYKGGALLTSSTIQTTNNLFRIDENSIEQCFATHIQSMSSALLKGVKQRANLISISFILEKDYCHPNPCDHDGQCELVNNVAGFKCKCAPGYMGQRCSGTSLFHVS